MGHRASLYRASWYWNIDHLTYHSLNDNKQARQQARQILTVQSTIGDAVIQFLENADQSSQKVFKHKYQRVLKQNAQNIITLQDIKDVVTFLMVGALPKMVIALFHSDDINNFFRALIVYFQLYLQVWEDLKYRRDAYSQRRLKHPISVKREGLCRSKLSELRSRVGQEYALLISGENGFKVHHHMNNTINRSYTAKDITLYEYLFKFSARVIWVALYRSNYKEIELELSRILSYSKNVSEEIIRPSQLSVELNVTVSDENILHGVSQCVLSNWKMQSPAISDIFLNKDKPEMLLSNNVYSPLSNVMKVSGLDAALTLPEELLNKFNITVGILGQLRDNFETMLHVKQGPVKTLEEKEMEKTFTILNEQVEKPAVKMYEYLKQLETPVDLCAGGTIEDIILIEEEIESYFLSHIEDSKMALRVWKRTKGA